MSKLSRFLRLERARPADGGDEETPHVPARFGGIETPHGEPPESALEPDPFAPPPEPKVHLELAEPSRREEERRRARAEAELVKTRDELIIQKLRQAEIQENRFSYGPLGKLSVRDRVITIGVTALACAIVTELWRPIVWGLFPILVVLIVVSAFTDRD